ncbi:hypothetical protein D3C76_1845980 [compost metagenome]
MYTLNNFRNRGYGRKLITDFVKRFQNKLIVAYPYTLDSQNFFVNSGFTVNEQYDPIEKPVTFQT